MIQWLAVIICLIKSVECDMEPFIVGGDYTSIILHPHSAFMNVDCTMAEGGHLTWVCGASIVNQWILLTAAHCLATCMSSSSIQIAVGSENRYHGVMNSASSILVHEDYDSDSSYADIGLMKLAWRLKLSFKISRVAMMREPPYNELATVAGWGLTDEDRVISSPYLKYINQTIKNRRECLKLIWQVPQGCICARSRKISDYASSGDSGSALMIRGYIQIGIVSHKIPEMARNVIVYTEIAYYYDWIKKNTKRLYCVK